MSDAEQMIRIEERLRQMADEYPAFRKKLQSAADEMRDIRERLARVEQNHKALEKAVFEMKSDLKDQLAEFKSFVLWTIGAGITVSGIVVSGIQHILGGK